MREGLLKKRNDDPFKLLGISNEDKMTYFLLKWVFNAIKLDSDPADKQLQGQPYVQKRELIKQLVKNREVMNAMNCTNAKKLATEVNIAACAKEGTLVWSEFLDFHFLRDATFEDRIDSNDWWNKIDANGKRI